jgi:hypothetical protein
MVYLHEIPDLPSSQITIRSKLPFFFKKNNAPANKASTRNEKIMSKNIENNRNYSLS